MGADFPDARVSVYQIVSGQTDMVPQDSRKMVTSRFVGTAVFGENFSGFSYAHFMTSFYGHQTLEAKVLF